MNIQRITLFISCAALLWASGIVPAIIPQSVPAANKIGNSTKFQLGTGTPTSGNCASYDANANVQDFGAPCNGTAGSVAFNNITSGTNTTMAGLMGTGGTLTSSGTGVVETNKVRNYTVSTLPTATGTGAFAYVTDGNSSTDCTTGSGSTKVLCQANGTAWGAVGTGAAPTFSTPYIISGGNTYTTLFAVTTPPTSSWTQINFGASTVNQAASGALTFAWENAAGNVARGYMRTKSAPYTDTIFCTQNGAGCALMIYDGTKATTYFYGNDGKLHGFNWTNTSTFASRVFNDITVGGAPTHIWMKLADDSANEVFSLSVDGTNWVQVSTRASGTFLTATSVGIGNDGAGQTAFTFQTLISSFTLI